MIELKYFEDVEKITRDHDLVLLYAGDYFCIVCQDMKPLVDQLAKDLNLPIYSIDIDQNAMARGQLNLFTAPVVMVYYQGKEVYRQGRFLDLKKLKATIKTYQDYLQA